MTAAKHSAGFLMFRRRSDGIDLFLVHPGGPFFESRDQGAWSIPKGEVESGEDPLAVAAREFLEETGRSWEACAAAPETIPLGSVRQRGGKQVEAWAFEGDWAAGEPPRSNTFSIEWPTGSGRSRQFPEVDRAEFFDEEVARRKINPAQAELIDRLLERLESTSEEGRA